MTAEYCDLAGRHCTPCAGGTLPLGKEEVEQFLAAFPGWEAGDGEIRKTFTFANYYQTISFVNAVAWIAHREDHHPDLEVSYKRCRVRFRTHAIGGLSENDFICAAKIDGLLP